MGAYENSGFTQMQSTQHSFQFGDLHSALNDLPG